MKRNQTHDLRKLQYHWRQVQMRLAKIRALCEDADLSEDHCNVVDFHQRVAERYLTEIEAEILAQRWFNKTPTGASGRADRALRLMK